MIPLTPAVAGMPLRVVILGRLSRPKETAAETQKTIASSFAFGEEHIRKIYPGEVSFTLLGEQVSGLFLNRQTILEAQELIERGECDLILAEDLSRIYRNPRHQFSFVQNCVDAEVRLICIADGLDTAEDNWETMLGAATLRHGLYIPDTRRRIKRTAKYSFHQGGMVQKPKFGYRKLSKEEADAATAGPKGLRIARVKEHQATFDEIRRRLVLTRSPARVVDWLNAAKIPVGPYVQRDHWNAPLFKNLVTDPILSGTRMFQKVLYKPIMKTGNHRREKNSEPLTAYVGELAFMTKDEQE
jgi:DNA invertase Pin-like site-specific DNA recombinase